MSDIKTNIPLPIAPLTDSRGQISEVWWRFFLDIFNRTGGGSGNNGGTIEPVYSDILAAVIPASNDVSPFDLSSPSSPTLNVEQPLSDVRLPVALPPVQELSPFEALFAMPPSVSPLSEMVFAPVLATDSPTFVSITYSGTLSGGSASLSGLSTNGTSNVNLGTDTTSSGINLRGANSGTAGGSFWAIKNNGTNILIGGNKSAILGGAYDATPYIFGNATIEFNQSIKVPGGAVFLLTSSALTNGAGAGAGTISNAPAAGNPTKWIGINDNGTIRYIPSW